MSLRNDSAAMVLYAELPPEVRKEWGPRKVRRITGDLYGEWRAVQRAIEKAEK